MTVINHKSISGITSITAPAGSDNLLTVHTNDTTERFRIVDSGAIVTGVTTASNFKTGTTNVHNVGVELAGINVLGADTPIGTGATIYNSGAAVFTGIVTATNLTVSNQIGINESNPTGKLTITNTHQGFVDDSAQPQATFLIKHGTSGTDRRWIGIGADTTGAWLQSSSPGGSGLAAPFWINRGGGDVSIGSGGTKLFVKHSSAASVGIGTNVPIGALHLNYNGNNGVSFRMENFEGYSTIHNDGAAFHFDSAQHIFRNANGSSEFLRIHSGGQIGIRNTNATSFNTGGDDLVIGNATDGQDAGITLYSHSSDNGSIFFNDTADTGLTGLIQYRHSEDAMRFITNTLERLRITSDGDVTIGRDSVLGSAKLSIQCDAGEPGISVQLNASAGTSDLIKAYSSAGPNVASICVNPDATPDLLFKVYNGSNTVERLRIDTSGNVGQAVTPSAWSSAQANDFFAYQVGSGTALFGRGSGDEDRGGISANLYCTASAWKYIANGNGGRIYFEDGNIVFNTCDSGTAGGTATLNERFKITTDGNIYFSGDQTGNNRGIIYNHAAGFGIYASASSGVNRNIIFYRNATSSSESLRIQSDGRVKIANGGDLYVVGSSYNAKLNGNILEFDRAGYSYIDQTSNSGALSFRVGASAAQILRLDTANAIFPQGTLYLGTQNTSSGHINAYETMTFNIDTDNDDTNRYFAFYKNGASGSGSELFRIGEDGRVGIKFQGNYTMNAASTNLVIGDGGSGVGMTLWTASGADNQTISFQTNETLSRAEGEISYGPTHTSTTANRNVMMFRTNSAERLRINSKGQLIVSPSSDPGSAATSPSISIVQTGNSAGTYPGISLKSLSTGGGNGMSMYCFDNNWDLYSRSGNQTGLAFLTDVASNSANARMVIGADGKVCLGTEVYANLSTSRDSYAALHIAGGGCSIGPKGNNSATRQGGRYILGWYMMSAYTGHSYIHVVTDLWGGASSGGGNYEYIMGGFHIHGHAYSGSGVSEERIYFHNWGGNLHGHSRHHTGTWNPGNNAYINSNGWVTLRLLAGSYRGYIIDLVQHAWYGPRNINVTAHTGSDSSTI